MTPTIWILFGLALLLALVAGGLIVRGALVAHGMRKRLAAAYVTRTATEPLRAGQLVVDAGQGQVRAARAAPPPRPSRRSPADGGHQ